MEQKLWYDTPAKKFSEALPIGNGTLGAMVYGDFPDFHYSLNADTLWSGCPGRKVPVRVQPEERQKVKDFIKEGKYKKAEQIVQEYMVGEQYNESYLGAGFLHLEFLEECREYSLTRELRLDTACAKTEIETGQGRIRIESFASGPEEVLVTHVTGEVPVSAVLRADSLLRFSCRAREGELELWGEAPSHVEPNYVESETPVCYGGGMKFSILTRVACDGKTEAGEEQIRIREAREIILYTTITTGFRGYDKPLEENRRVLRAEGDRRLQKAMGFEYPRLKERQEQAHRSLFDRVSLDLQGGEENHWYELLFDYGRYLMIASSQPGGSFGQPANLQGIWCEDVRSVWSSNFTVNINTEMNYWLTGPCALSECDGPLIRMIGEAAAAGRETARETCGRRGFAICHNVDLWRHTAPVDGEAKWAYWPMGGVWLTTHLYQHYLYTNDRDFLREQAYPVMEECARFCMDSLYEENGIWYTAPNTSPENTFLGEGGQSCCISRSVTMDHALIREVLSDTLAAGNILGKEPEFLQQVETALSRLPQYRTGVFGQLLEWGEDFPEEDVNHRHFAHLVGFHPFHQIDFETRPQLLSAVERVLERRTKGMEIKIGWTEAWLTNFRARLRDGEGAKAHLDSFLRHCTYPNLLGLHPPLGASPGEREIFQIDGNFGAAAGIVEMLLQAKPGYVCLLPALPKAWDSGAIKGLVLPGGHRADISWKGGRLTEAALSGGSDDALLLVSPGPFSLLEPGGNLRAAVGEGIPWKSGKARRNQEIRQNTMEYKINLIIKKNSIYKIYGHSETKGGEEQ